MKASTRRDVRRLAFQAIFQIDARPELEPGDLRTIVGDLASETAPSLSPDDVDRAVALASDAYRARRQADAAVAELAPEWPAPRQPATDRAILRLAHFEMFSADTPPKVAVNEAIELAKKFGTERSPAFVNGVLDKLLKQAIASRHDSPAPVAPPTSEGEPTP